MSLSAVDDDENFGFEQRSLSPSILSLGSRRALSHTKQGAVVSRTPLAREKG